MSRLSDVSSQFVQNFTGHLTSNVKPFLLVVICAGFGIGGWALGQQVVASFTYESAVATIVVAGPRCETARGAMRSCSQAQVDQLKARKSNRRTDYQVTFSFYDASGLRRSVTGGFAKTGLSREEAVRGGVFNLLYDPADPSRTSLPPGADHQAVLQALAGLAALCFYLAIFGLPFGLALGRRRMSNEFDDVQTPADA